MSSSHKAMRALTQLLSAALAIALAGLALLAVKWQAFAGWTWQGFLTDAKTLPAICGGTFAVAGWLFALFRSKDLSESLLKGTRSMLLSDNLWKVNSVLSMCLVLLLLFLGLTGERLIGTQFRAHVERTNWSGAANALAAIEKDPIRPEILSVFRRYLAAQRLSEGTLGTDARLYRVEREEALRTADQLPQYRQLGLLSYAEYSKAIYFIEGDPNLVSEAVLVLEAKAGTTKQASDQGRLLAAAGGLLLAATRYEDAERLLQAAAPLESDPIQIARNQANLGAVYSARGEYKKALASYRFAEKTYPGGLKNIFYSNFAFVLLRAGEIDDAAAAIDRALAIAPNDWISYLNRGLIREAQGNYQDAVRDFEITIRGTDVVSIKREAQIFAGRTLEIAGKPRQQFISYYLLADQRSANPKDVKRVAASPKALSALYTAMAMHLRKTGTNNLELYIDWFHKRASEEASK